MGVLEDIAAWLGVDSEPLGWVLGIAFIVSFLIATAALDRRGNAVPITGFVAVIFVIIVGLWPLWVALILIVAGAAYILFGGVNVSGSSRGD